MAEYYGQRAGAGLIITEGTAPSADGLGYARSPAIYSEDQIEGWEVITRKVHENGGKIFLQIMHAGRMASPLNKPKDAKTVAPSALKAEVEMYTDQEGMVPTIVPHALDEKEIEMIIDEFVQASKNAIKAGFDGVEIHGANGYLVEQFINPKSNIRTDKWGGSLENRIRFALEIAEHISKEIGKEKVGIRLSPYGAAGDLLPSYEGIEETYFELAKELSKIGILYMHIVDHSSMGAHEVPQSLKSGIRKHFDGTYIATGGFTAETAEADIEAGHADLIGFGRPFISNPDLVEKMKNHEGLSPYKMDTFYTPGPEGYTDYPVLLNK
jgi:N-ethylmaleimide reductase